MTRNAQTQPWSPTRTRLYGAMFLVLAWLVVTLIAASAWHFDGYWTTPNPTWIQTVGQHGCIWSLWALLTPFLFWLARRRPLVGAQWLPNLGIHLGISLLWGALYFGIMVLLVAIWNGRDLPSEYGRVARNLLTYTTLLEYFVFWVLALAGHGYAYLQSWRRKQEEAAALAVQNSALSAKLVEAELATLKSQLQPHFLFNTLNSIVGHIRTGESDVAQNVVLSLSDLLRYTLEGGAEFVPSHREFEFVRKYLRIQKSRFGDRIDVQVQLQDECREILIPPLLLQPLVENAVHHGVVADRSDNRISVTGRVDGNRLLLEVSNTRGEGVSNQPGFGIGMKNVRERLERIYGDRARLVVKDETAGEMLVRLDLPSAHPDAANGTRGGGDR